MMDIFLLLPSCGWYVNLVGCIFKFSFPFSCVVFLGIRVLFPLVINSLSIIDTQ